MVLRRRTTGSESLFPSVVRRLSESPTSGWRGDVTGQVPESTLDGFSVSTDQPPPCGDSEAHPRCFSEFRDAGSRSSEKIGTQPNLVSILSSVTYLLCDRGPQSTLL